MTAVEINKNRQTLVWRRHLLTEVAESRQLTDLLLEPALDLPEQQRVGVEILSDETALRWEWGVWNRVEISAANATFTFVKSQPAEINWQQLPAGSEIELTFHGSNGATGRAKVQVPEEANFGRDVEFGVPINGLVDVRIASDTSYSSIVAHWLLLGQQKTFRWKGAPIVFGAGQLKKTLPIPRDYAGILALLATQNNTWKLIGAADYKDNSQLIKHHRDSEHVRDLRHFLRAHGFIDREETENYSIQDWLQSWPSDSQRRLRELYKSAREHLAAVDADELIRHCPTGLFRYLVLQSCGFKSPDIQRLIRRLNNNDFETALRSAAPALSAALEVLTSSAERIWAIQHAHHKNLLEAATEAASHGIGALARALHLVEKRHEAIAAWNSRRRVPSF